MNYTATDIVLIITAISTGIAVVIGAWKGNKKLNEIKEQANGAASTAAMIAADTISVAEGKLLSLHDEIAELTRKLQVVQERRLSESRERGPLPFKVDQVKKDIADHDIWERENSMKFTKLLEDNTKLTKEIFEYLKKK